MKKEITENNKYKSANNLLQELIKWKKIGGLSYLKIGQLLKSFKEERLYENLGESPEFESFEQFITIPAIDIKLRKAYYLIQIWDKFCIQLNFKPEELSEISWTTLRLLLPVVKSENSQNLIEEAKTLRRTDLEVKVAQLKSGWSASGECKHPLVEEVTFYICQDCKERFKYLPPESKIINDKPKNKENSLD